jgi:hypothetical protein
MDHVGIVFNDLASAKTFFVELGLSCRARETVEGGWVDPSWVSRASGWSFGLQLEGRLVQTSDPNLDERVAGVGCVKAPRPTARAEAATVIA